MKIISRKTKQLEENSKWNNMLGFALLVGLLSLFGYLAIRAYILPGVDFRMFFAGAKLLAHGQNPYDYQLIYELVAEITGTYYGNVPYYYPLWLALIMIPYTFFPFHIARIAWILTIVVTFFFGSILALKLMPITQSKAKKWLIITAVTYLFLWANIFQEQVAALLFFAIALSLWGYHTNNYPLAGIALAFAASKPNITMLPVVALGLFYLSKQRKSAIWAIETVSIFVIITNLIIPGWSRHYLEPNFGEGAHNQLEGPGIIAGKRFTVTLLDWLPQFGIQQRGYIVIWIVLALVGLFLLWQAWKHQDVILLTAVAVSLNMVLTPYAMGYDFPVLTLPFIWILYRLRNKRNYIPSVIVLVVLLIFPFFERISYDAYWITLGIFVLIALQLPPLEKQPQSLEPDIIRSP